jgi:Two-component sensor kinase N-terminal
MTFGHFQSLQFRLALPLAALYVAATAIAVGVLFYQAYDTAGSLNDRELSLRADDLARAISTDDAGKAHLNLPPKLSSAYAAAAGDNIFAIRDSTGSLIAALPDEFSDRTSSCPQL